ncbi:MAG: hypothetical protein M0Z66_05870 [Thermaerobacter sp.]|nr:hypothetical protein [Thermaerobacter sp.]
MGSRIEMVRGSGKVGPLPKVELQSGRDLHAQAQAAIAGAVRELKKELDERTNAMIERQNQFEQVAAGAFGGLQQDLGNVMLRYFAMTQVLEDMHPGFSDLIDKKIAHMAEQAAEAAKMRGEEGETTSEEQA